MTIHGADSQNPLNQGARNVSEYCLHPFRSLSHRFESHQAPNGGRWFDFGIKAEGGLEAGLILSQGCLSNLATPQIVDGQFGDQPWPYVQLRLDHPTEACLLSQYAGWRVSLGDFFGMLSGPIRAVAAREELFHKLEYKEESSFAVGVIETEQPPTEAVFQELSEKAGVPPAEITLFVAPTSSQAGTIQIVARSVETAMHKLFELGFDVRRVRSAWGTAPLPPCGADFLTSLGRTNDAILYGARVHLWVSGDPEDIKALGPKVPSDASEAHGKPFREIFEEAGGDFYKIDPHLFSPAQIVINSLETGEVFQFGHVAPNVLKRSFGI
ncbi:MAG: methenyltetrahydromethanopterin cyclohydrolase [Planctomycetaceae bacterium]|nr:methenyltetrahydromethanopterin cyclohydrolase [Planctomycetaceae bacterium]